MTVSKLKIPSTPSKIKDLEQYIQSVAEQFKLCQDTYSNILISLTEAVNNAILHGNKGDDSKYVDIRLIEKESYLAFHVSDEGPGFDPNKIPDPTLEENIEACGGRGVYIMKSLSDDISYSDNGRTVKIRFNL